MSQNRKTLLGLIAALLILAADQDSKWWVLEVLDLENARQVVVLPVLNFTMVWNRGVTFGMLGDLGDWGHIILTAVPLMVVAALALWLRRAESGIIAAAIGAICGGAVGNVIDRVRFGAVVDFIHAHIGGLSWYVFNVADAAIVCGVAAWLIDSQWRGRAHASTTGAALRDR